VVQEAGSLVCVQEKLKQLQADVDCILQACYEDADDKSNDKGDKDERCKHSKPNCEGLKVLNSLSSVTHRSLYDVQLCMDWVT